MRGTKGVVTPYTGLSLADEGSRTLPGAGARWNIGAGTVLGLEGRREQSGSEAATNAVMLRAEVRW